ncbi:hypothetical protein ACR3K2_27150, partial [Cryptosporidium serpentis]
NLVTVTSPHDDPVTTVISSHDNPVTIMTSSNENLVTVTSPHDDPVTTMTSSNENLVTVTSPHDNPVTTTQQSPNLTSIKSSTLTQSNSLTDEETIDISIPDHNPQKLPLSELTQVESQNFTEQMILHNIPSEKISVIETNTILAPSDVNLVVVSASKFQDPVDITVQPGSKDTTVDLAKLDTIQPAKTKKWSSAKKLRGITPRAVLESSEIGQVVIVTSTS